MRLAHLCIARPVSTALLTLALVFAGALAFYRLPIAPMPQVDYPIILVQATMPGASPEAMAQTVAAPLERRLGQIADVADIESSSNYGSSQFWLTMNLSRNIDAAARDVMAAISAARADLPVSLRANPSYAKYNPSDFPILILAISSNTLSRGQLFDLATQRIKPRVSQISGVGQVLVTGASLSGVRIELKARTLFGLGIGFEDVRAAVAAANANMPKGAVEVGGRRLQIYANDQAVTANDYRQLIVAWRNGAAVRLGEVADVVDSVEDLHQAGLVNGEPGVQIVIYRQPGTNIVETTDQIRALVPGLAAALPSDVALHIVMDRTLTIRASLRDIELALLASIFFVILVVFLFLRDLRATLIVAVVVPISLIGTFGAMYLLNYSLDNLSLMALTVAVGFVVDDAIIVVENVMRHIEAGKARRKAAIQGAREVTFTIVSMSVSLIAVFTPIFFMSGLIGRLFREFVVTLSVAVVLSLILALTTTPMLCAHFLRPQQERRRNFFATVAERGFNWTLRLYGRTLPFVLRHQLSAMVVLVAMIGLNVYLIAILPKGLVPIQDTGRLRGYIVADQNISAPAMQDKLRQFIDILDDDPAVDAAVGSVGVTQGGVISGNLGAVLVWLKPLRERGVSADEAVARMRRKWVQIPGASLSLQSVQDLYFGGSANNLYAYSLESEDLATLRAWAPRLTEALRHRPEFADVNSDQQDKSILLNVLFDRKNIARLGLTLSQIDNSLYDAFGQRLVSTLYGKLSQHHVVMEADPARRRGLDDLTDFYVSTSGAPVGGAQATNALAGVFALGNIVSPASRAATAASDPTRNARINQLGNLARGSASTAAAVSTTVERMIPLANLARVTSSTASVAVNHHGNSAAVTLTFNLAPGKTSADAQAAIREAANEIGMPTMSHGRFLAAGGVVDDAAHDQTILILGAIATIYIALGILYESLVDPLIIIASLPSAGVGGLLALLAFGMDFNIIAVIGAILLTGVSNKNAIMMIDFAIRAERQSGLSARDAIQQACLLRFRPILMTTLVALLGALPLLLNGGEGAEIRRPLGVMVVGGLTASQILTLYTTPVLYLVAAKFRMLFHSSFLLTKTSDQTTAAG